MNQISKSTLIPLGLVVFLLGFTYQIGTSHAQLKSKISYLERADSQQAEVIKEITQQLNKLNENIIRQSEIMKNLSDKIN